MKWEELTRMEKVKRLFDLPLAERQEKAKELWGEEADLYPRVAYFPPSTPFAEIAEVLRNVDISASIRINLSDDDFHLETDGFKSKYEKDEAMALWRWHGETVGSKEPALLNLELYGEDLLVTRVCTERGYMGDEDGFGVEPDMWASALFDYNGNVVRPFSAGYLLDPDEEE